MTSFNKPSIAAMSAQFRTPARYLSIIVLLAILAGCDSRTANEQTKKTADETAAVPGNTLPDSVLARRFSPEFASVDALADAFLLAVRKRDREALAAMLINEREFNDWLWPEFPASDPAMNVPEDFAWQNLAIKSDKGLKRILREIGGRSYLLVSVLFTDADEHFKYFTVRGGSRIEALDEQAKNASIRYVGSVVEMNGTFKFMSYRE